MAGPKKEGRLYRAAEDCGYTSVVALSKATGILCNTLSQINSGSRTDIYAYSRLGELTQTARTLSEHLGVIPEELYHDSQIFPPELIQELKKRRQLDDEKELIVWSHHPSDWSEDKMENIWMLFFRAAIASVNEPVLRKRLMTWACDLRDCTFDPSRTPFDFKNGEPHCAATLKTTLRYLMLKHYQTEPRDFSGKIDLLDWLY